ncbi:MAG TPA: hydroxymethylbilane synthase [Pyrinomonadaceae bacterium]|nr:hydroxymethylbilane synthase [Pyrinomonadaceae bacterium]
MRTQFVIGSRGSQLALAQAHLIQEQLLQQTPGIEVRIEIIKTTGDVSREPLSIIGGQGVFTKELEDALLNERIDLAVHSLKDLPTITPHGLAISAICKRDDPRDALVLPMKSKAGASLQELASGAVAGTSSPRRLAQLKSLRPDLVFKDVRGNVDTRLRKLDDGEYDALILACAGLRRLHLDNRITAALPTEQMLPAVGQGALAIETRAADADSIELTVRLDHKFSRVACAAERALLRQLGGGCQLPIAAHSVVRDKRVRLDGLIAATDGTTIVRERVVGGLDEAEELGRLLAETLLENGGRELLGR